MYELNDYERKLLKDCGFGEHAIDLSDVSDDLQKKLLTFLNQWRFNKNQKEFERRHAKSCRSDNKKSCRNKPLNEN